MRRPLAVCPETKREESFMGSHIQSIIHSEKCLASGAINYHHVDDVQSGTRSLAMAFFCSLSFLQIFPVRLKRGEIVSYDPKIYRGCTSSVRSRSSGIDAATG
jgi:hypothetical protein